jgi:amidophosphoribosyltransferase
MFCGISTSDGDKIKLLTNKGLVKHSFMKDDLKRLEGYLGIGHVSLRDRQPILLDSKLGEFALAYSGNIVNSADLSKELKNRGHSFLTNYDVEILAKLVGEGTDIESGIERMAEKVIGAYSLVILKKDEIYAVRDPYAVKPLILGENEYGWTVSSESCALNFLGFRILRDVEAGEIVHISKDGVKSVGKMKSDRKAHCAFEWGYFARYDSVIDGISVRDARNNLGAKLAEGEKVSADKVSCVPMSGIGYALGYHRQSGITYDEVYLYNRYSDRSYTPLEQAVRNRIANEKLAVVAEAVKDQRIILCDDSIVRGTQMKNKVKELKNAGAKEIHVRVGCPPLIAPCRYGISTKSYEELIARKYSIDEIRKKIKAKTLRYNTLEDFVEGIGVHESDLCLACWTGEYPT